METELISVIVPVYNVEKYLDKTLESLANQKDCTIEVILVNDGSKDESGKICEKWAQHDSRFRVIHQENGGPSRARNAGLDVAMGEFVLFCDSDDLFSPDMCRVLYNTLMQTGSNLAACDYAHIFPDRRDAFTTAQTTQVFTAQEVVQQMWYQTGFIPSACAKLYRRNIFASHRFTPGLIYEDIDLLHELYFTAERIAYTPSKLYGYVHHSNSITTAPFSQRNLDIFLVVKRILAFAKEHPELEPAAQAYAVAAALRIFLNAPDLPEYAEGIAYAKDLLQKYGKITCADKNARRKNRYATRLYFLSKPMLRFIYKRVDRWK